jgi:hypothetical protein
VKLACGFSRRDFCGRCVGLRYQNSNVQCFFVTLPSAADLHRGGVAGVLELQPLTPLLGPSPLPSPMHPAESTRCIHAQTPFGDMCARIPMCADCFAIDVGRTFLSRNDSCCTPRAGGIHRGDVQTNLLWFWNEWGTYVRMFFRCQLGFLRRRDRGRM